MTSISRRARAAIATLVLAALITPAAAQASDTQLSIMQDDDHLLYRGDTVRDQTLKRMKALGVDAVRVTVLWSVVAEKTNDKSASKAQRKRFKQLGASNPKAYPKLNWDRYDRLARACVTLQVRCFFNVTGPGPSYGHAKPPAKYKKDAAWWKPKPRQFYAFVQAVGKRFSGTYKDENDERRALPRVSMWSIWNEPNQGGWLRPQWLGGKPVSPALYRDLWFFGYRALVSTGHGGDQIFVGETAPRAVARKTTTSAMGARTFINAFFCNGGSSQGCNAFKKYGPVKATAWAHHYYTRTDAPTFKNPDPEVLSVADYPAFFALLDGIAAKTGRLAPGLPVVNSEFGYESSPPDPFNGISFDLQAQYNAQAELLGYVQPRVIGTSQFLLQDALPNKRFKTGSKPYWGTYQTGLLTAGLQPKPAATAYALPFLVLGQTPNELGQPVVTYWGQTKFRPDGIADGYQLQYKPADGSADWANLGDPLPITNPKGFFTGSVVVPGPGQLRVSWGGQAFSLGQVVS